MIKTILLAAMAAVVSVAAPMAANAAVSVGKPAPDFTAADTNGKEHKLSEFKGKPVVLEWTNPGCPFVQKQYDSGNMQKLQEEYTGKDVVWLTINSGAEGKQGHLTNEEANKYIADHNAKQTAVILDGNGAIGKLYDAKTTPHMFVIDKDGILVYDGAIDDNDSADKEDAAAAHNYVKAALDALAEGKPVERSKTKPYGCSVKY